LGLRIAEGLRVRVTYRLLDSDGRLLEERTPEDAFQFVVGDGSVLPPVERALVGKTAGFACEVSVGSRDGYGEYDSSLVTEVPRTHFGEDVDVRVGMKFNTVGLNGTPVVVRVIEFDDSTVTLDGNHPLAGLDLVFELRVLEVEDPAATLDPAELRVTMRKKTSQTH
jgi:FKBP-type peptidyl-prolyl cis-trans isomerase SlyD